MALATCSDAFTTRAIRIPMMEASTIRTMSAPVSPDGTIVVVGASLAGLRAAEEIRHEGHTGPVIVAGEEIHAPYDRPPLSKQVLSGKWDTERIRLGRRATGLDTAGRTIAFDDGQELAYDGLVIATGAATRRLPGTEGMVNVWVLRTLDDCLGIRADLAAAGVAPRLIVIGAGFIGSEVAATCQGTGARVTLLEAYHTPLARVLGDQMGRMCADLHIANGMDLRTSVTIDHLESDPGGPDPVTVVLDDGTRLPADVVVVGIGVTPAVAWLEGSDVELDNGVRCDGSLFATDGVVAAGDVANWTRPTTGRPTRVEHWTNAAEGGAASARNLLAGTAGATPYDPVPFFWSDQYSTKIQMIGLPDADDEVVVVSGSGEEGKLVALYRVGDRLGAVLTFSQPAKLMGYRPLLAAGASFDEALAHARS
jgi:NADPH-dependent 2,4-dienoyl-CoA reductase/sulfur reductase-like enzyme